MTDIKMKWRTIKIAKHKIAGHEMTDQIAGHENTGHEIERHDKYLSTVVFTNPIAAL